MQIGISSRRWMRRNFLTTFFFCPIRTPIMIFKLGTSRLLCSIKWLWAFQKIWAKIWSHLPKSNHHHHDYYRYFRYVNDVTCQVQLCSFVGYEKHYGSHWDVICTESRYLGNFEHLNFFTIEPAFQWYGDVTCRSLLMIGRNIDGTDCT